MNISVERNVTVYLQIKRRLCQPFMAADCATLELT
jgi:hypothetical protein